MTELRSGKPILNVLRGRAVEPRPVWLMRQAGRYLPEYRELRAKASDFLSLCFTPTLASEITLQPMRRFDFDGAILFADILVVPHALGQKVWFAEGEGPRLDPITGEGISRLKAGSVRSVLSPICETIDRVKSQLPKATALIGFAGAPWTVATYMIAGRGSEDSAAARLFAYNHPRDFLALLDVLVEATSEYLIAQIEAGAEVLQIFESWAGTIPAGKLNDYSLRPIERIIKGVHERTPSIPIIVFPRGTGANYPHYATETGATAISLDAHTSLASAAKTFPANTVLQGNLDPLALVAGGDALETAVEEIKLQTQGRAHIFNLGHGVRPETPVEHVAQLLCLIRKSSA